MARFTKGLLVFICGVATKLSSVPMGNMLMYPFKSDLESYPRSIIKDYIIFIFAVIYLYMRFVLFLFRGYPFFFLTSLQIFQPLKDESLAAPDRASSLSFFETQSAPLKGLHVETRAGDSSPVDGDSLLASISKLHNVPFLPPTAKSVKRQQNSEGPVLPSGCNDCIPDVDMNDSNNDHAAIASTEKTVASTSCAANDEQNADGNGIDPFQEAEFGNIPPSGFEVRPILSLLGDPSEFDLRSSISKILVDDRSEVREMPKEYDRPSALVSTRRQALKDSLLGGVLNPQDIDISFENFPYYLRSVVLIIYITFYYTFLLQDGKVYKFWINNF